MFKKTKVRSVLELLGKNLSAREVSKVLGVSRNTVAEVQALFLQSGRSWDDISEWDDDRLYGLFYPDKFKYKPRYAPADYSYVHKELKKTGVTEKLLWEEYCAMSQLGTVNREAYLRKMALDGYVVKLDLPELKELVSLMRYSSNNLNQLTRKVHETGRVYDADLEDISQRQEQLWDGVQKILAQLSKLS